MPEDALATARPERKPFRPDAACGQALRVFQSHVGRWLRRRGAQLRAVLLMVGLGRFVAACALVALADFLIDRQFRLDYEARVMLLGLMAGVGLWALWRWVVSPLGVRLGAEQVALLYERRIPSLKERLITAVQLSAQLRSGGARRDGVSEALAARVLEEAAEVGPALQRVRLIRWRRVVLWGGSGAMCLLAVGAGVWAQPQEAAIWWARNVWLEDVAWPQRTHLIVAQAQGQELRHPRGDDLEVVARCAAGSAVPREVSIEYAYSSGLRGREMMTLVGGEEFRFRLPRVVEPLQFRLRGGDAITPWYRVVLLERPRLTDLAVRVSPPAYTGLEPLQLREGQHRVDALAGSEVSVEFAAQVPLAEARIMADEEAAAVAEPVGEDGLRWGARWVVMADGTYRFDLVSREGLRPARPSEIVVHIRPDDPPEVRLETRGVSHMVTPQAVIPLVVRCADDFGLSGVEVRYGFADRPGEVQEVGLEDFRPGSREFAARTVWAVSTLGAQPGAQIELYAVAWDFNDIAAGGAGSPAGGAKGHVGQEGTSEVTQLVVVRPEELLAELARREQELRHEFESLLNQQEDLRDRWLALAVTAGAGGRMDAARADDLAVRQRRLAAQITGIADRFADMLAEMKVNAVATRAHEQRLEQQIIGPLERLSSRDLADLVVALEQVADEDPAAQPQRVDPLMQSVIETMRRVLAQMIQWEGFQEAITLLQEIISLQERLHRDVQRAIEEQTREIFD